MYERAESQMIMPGDFFLPFGGKLSEDNRWVLLAQMIPWWKIGLIAFEPGKRKAREHNRHPA